MQQPRNVLPQEVPAGFADQLREMRDAGDLRLNAVLAAARAKGWRTATLAKVLNMNPTACSKRIERAEPPTADMIARQSLMTAASKMAEINNTKAQQKLWKLGQQAFPSQGLAEAVALLDKMSVDRRSVRTAKRAIERAVDYVQPPRADISGIDIPEPPSRPAAMMNGQRLTPEEKEYLAEMMAAAKKLNGATPATLNGHKHPLRQASESFSKHLNDLITKRGFTPYYLARELGVTHRAITSRLERHGYRTPCPSVRGTPSGMYRGHKIGEKVA